MTLNIDLLQEELKSDWLKYPSLGRDAIRAKHRQNHLNRRCLEEISRAYPGADFYEAARQSLGDEFKESEHPRAGSRDPHNPGKFAPKGAAGGVFASPNVGHLKLGEARHALMSHRHRAFRSASADIDRQTGVAGREDDVIGAWADGAENSVMLTAKGANLSQLRLNAAMKGLLGHQKSILIFKDDLGGPNRLYSFHMDSDIDEAHEQLSKAGLEYHTLVPRRDGVDAIVVDLDGSAFDPLDKFAEDNNLTVSARNGEAQFIGTSKEDGSDEDQRSDADNTYLKIINEDSSGEAGRIWSRIHNRWSASFNGQEAISSIRADVAHRSFQAITTGTDTEWSKPFKAVVASSDFTSAIQNAGLIAGTKHIPDSHEAPYSSVQDVMQVNAIKNGLDLLDAKGFGNFAAYIKKNVTVTNSYVNDLGTIMATAGLDDGTLSLMIAHSFDPNEIRGMTPEISTYAGRAFLKSLDETGDTDKALQAMFDTAALHEFGHVFDYLTHGFMSGAFVQEIRRIAKAEDQEPGEWVKTHITQYAANDIHEGAAEAFCAIMIGELPTELDDWKKNLILAIKRIKP